LRAGRIGRRGLSGGGGGAELYSTGDTWIWSVTQTSGDNVSAFSMTEEVTGLETRRGYECWVVKSTNTAEPGRHSLDYLYVDEGGIHKVLGTTYSGGSKAGEQVYVGPALTIEFPLGVGNKWTDTGSVSGYSDPENVELIGMERTSANEVLRREEVTVSTETFDCWVIESLEILDGTHTGWYSEDVRNFVKEERETTTVMTVLEASYSQTVEVELRLSSYSVG